MLRFDTMTTNFADTTFSQSSRYPMLVASSLMNYLILDDKTIDKAEGGLKPTVNRTVSS